MEMTMSTGTLTAQRRQQLEQRIKVDMTCAYEKIVDVGRCLLAAKEENLIPHGHWTEWVQEVCGMNERQAQRWMQIAREVPEGSYLSRLDITRMRDILSLPDPEEREQVAKEALEKDLSTRELEKQIAELKRDRSALQQEVNETEQKFRKANVELLNAKDYLAAKNAKILELEKQAKAAADGKISPTAQREIDRLKRELEDANAFGDIQSAKRQEAQNELMKLKQSMRDGVKSVSAFSAEDLTVAVNHFLLGAGTVPQMGADFADMDAQTRRAFEMQVEIVSQWVEGAHRALATVAGVVVNG